jgi:peptide/nickel transport system substrate-binding protein
VSASKSRYDRRTFLKHTASTASGVALMGGGAGLLCSACGGTHSSSIHRVGTPGVSRAAPKRGGTITVGVNSEVGGFLPSMDNFDNTGTIYADTVFDTLTKVGADGTIHPYLAASVSPNSDRTVWKVLVRRGVLFHDGSPLTADVVVANFRALKGGLLTSLALGPISQIAKVDDYSVQYTCSEPLIAFPAYLTTQVGYVVALSQLERQDTQKPVGTGPFRYVSWVPNDHFTVDRNPNYWRSGLPYLDGITYKPIIADQSREEALRSGTIDMMVTRDPGAIVDLGNDPSFQQVNDLHNPVGQPNMDYIILNTSVEPLNDLTVRQALARATDVKQLLKIFGRGIVPPNLSLFPPGSPYRPADNGYPTYDLQVARRLAAEAALRHGGRLVVSLGTIPDPRLTEAVQALQSMWETAGFEVSISEIEQGTFIENLATGRFQACTDEGFTAVDPDLNYVWLSPTTIIGGVALNFARNRDPAIEVALQQGRTNPDPSVRAQAYQTVDKLLAKDLPYLWISEAPWSVTAKASVMNFANPILPDGSRGEGFSAGNFTPTQIWTTTA